MRRVDVGRIRAMVENLESIMNKKPLLRYGSLAVGSMDAITGMLLMVMPGWVLSILHISPVTADAEIFLRWIGVFVCGVGASYGLAAWGRAAAGEAVWIITAAIRLMVALFLVVQVRVGTMEAAWLMVAVSDGLVGLIQVAGVWLGWWRGDDS